MANSGSAKPTLPTMEGYLEKDGKAVMGFLGGGFQERYFKLEEATLTYWESRDDEIMQKEPKGKVDIWNAVYVEMEEDGLTINLTAFDQKDDKEQREYHLKAALPRDAKDWYLLFASVLCEWDALQAQGAAAQHAQGAFIQRAAVE